MEEKLKALVVAGIRLAIVRHDLATDEFPAIGDEAAEYIATDVWEALNGIGTCEEGPVDELTGVRAALESAREEAPVHADLGDLTQHGTNCGYYEGDCTCNLEWRRRLATEREMHNAWRKRAEEAEANLSDAREEARREAFLEAETILRKLGRRNNHQLADMADYFAEAIRSRAVAGPELEGEAGQ